MMKAVIANGPKDYQLVHDRAKPVLKEGEVLIKVLATGICRFVFCRGDFIVALLFKVVPT
jgi:D-arabinose 1-dehydrogenase-like Zn-dependent alcohol dehydrogenase